MDFMAEQLYWIALDCTSVPNRVSVCVLERIAVCANNESEQEIMSVD